LHKFAETSDRIQSSINASSIASNGATIELSRSIANRTYYEWLKLAWRACIQCMELNDPLNLMHTLSDLLNRTHGIK
jgi:hypothetical protein